MCITNIRQFSENSSLNGELVGGIGAGLDTLAQLRKTNLDTLKKRARAKFLSNALVFKLVDVDSELKSSYWNTYHCSKVLQQEGQKITSTYCNNRWCMVCNRIRTAKLINGYYPVLQEIPNKQFVTLTIPNCKGENLASTIDGMIKNFRRIKDIARKKKLSIIGIRKLECTWNCFRDDFHPHFHLVISGIDAAKFLVSEWLKKYPTATVEAQDIREATESSLIELFKYFTKLFPSPKKDGKKRFVTGEALDTMFRAMKSRRVFQPFGIKKIKEIKEDIDKLASQIIEDIENDFSYWLWQDDTSDWERTTDHQGLTGYFPSNADLQISGSVTSCNEEINIVPITNKLLHK